MASDVTYGRSKPGRPKNPPNVSSGPACEKCRNLHVSESGELSCLRLQPLKPCDLFADASKPRFDLGGTSGALAYR